MQEWLGGPFDDSISVAEANQKTWQKAAPKI